MNNITIRYPALISPIFLFSAIFLSGCIHSYYLPNSHNVPLLTEKNDVRASIGIYQGIQSGFEFQGSYAVGNKIGLMGSAMLNSGQNSYGESKVNYFDIGGGYFKPLNPHFVFEAYGIAGWGGARNTFENGSYNEANFTKFSLQPSVSYRSKVLDLALSWRLASLNFTSLRNTGGVTGIDLSDIQFIQNNNTSLLSEPAITIRLGYDKIKLQGQYGWSFNLSHPEFPQGNKTYVSLGILMSINAGSERKGK